MVLNVILGDVEELLRGIDGKLGNIEKLLELLLTPPDLMEYKKWKLTKRKGLPSADSQDL